MKKIIAFLLVMTIGLVLYGCGDDSALEEPSNTSPIQDTETTALYTSPDDFNGRTFEFSALVFEISEDPDSDMVALQAWYDIENYDKPTIIYYDNTSSLDFKQDDFIKVSGTIDGELEGDNAFGGTISAPTVDATSVAIISAADAFPATKTISVDETIEQYGCSLTVSKVDFTKTETRVFIKAENASSGEMSIYSNMGVLIQNGKQYETDYNSYYPEVSSDIKSGAYSEGVVTFPLVNMENFTISFEGYDDDYNDLNYEYTITLD
ncbi:MAG: hypothetical protein JJE03_06035 [Peptostreptococcaceae bacterium]|nr:hypothetical protein [Peptostreptococcaceae bacterium]